MRSASAGDRGECESEQARAEGDHGVYEVRANDAGVGETNGSSRTK
jgi:hypothetical protein